MHNQKGIKDAELDTMFESLNPTKRKLIAKEIKAKKKSDEVREAQLPCPSITFRSLPSPCITSGG